MADTTDDASSRAADLEIWAALATLLERLPTALDAQLQSESGISHFEYGILYALDQAPKRTLRLSVLAGYANCTLSRLSRAVSRLEASWWVRREIDPDDGRFTLAVLSESGHAKVTEATPGHRALIDRLVFASLTPAQTRQLGVISRRISAAITPDEMWRPPQAAPAEK